MEDLFTVSINTGNETIHYKVIFDEEKYLFVSETDDRSHTSFSFRREHDEWHTREQIPAAIKKQALDALESYLLKQH